MKGMNDMLVRLALLLLCIAASTLSAAAQEPENALKQYEGKILVLRHPLQSGWPPDERRSRRRMDYLWRRPDR
jgi:hypothetical protein